MLQDRPKAKYFPPKKEAFSAHTTYAVKLDRILRNTQRDERKHICIGELDSEY